MITKRLGVEHFGFKIIACLITLILWVTVISHKEMISTQNILIELVVPSEFKILGNDRFEVDLKIEGPRSHLKRYLEKSTSPLNLVIPIKNPNIGLNSIEISALDFQIPPELKIRSISPKDITINIIKATP